MNNRLIDSQCCFEIISFNIFYRLLNKSIIRVEQPDIHLDEDEPQYEPSMDVDQDTPNGTAGNVIFIYTSFLWRSFTDRLIKTGAAGWI